MNDECSMVKEEQVETVAGVDSDPLVIAGIEFKSRLWVGTGKYNDFLETKQAVEASGADVVRSEERRVGKECRSRRSPDH